MTALAPGDSTHAAPPLWRPVIAATLGTAMSAILLFWMLGMPPSAALPVGALAGIIGFLHIFLVGVPYALWMHRLGWFKAWTMTLGGFSIGAIPLGLIIPGPAAPLIFGGIGAGGALAFYTASRLFDRGR